MEYFKTFDISELITYLQIEPQPVNFKMVEEILLSREKSMKKRADYLEKVLKMYKTKFSKSSALEQNNYKGIAAEDKTREFRDYKMISDELEDKVAGEEDCKIVTEKETEALQNLTNLSPDLEKLHRSTSEELTLLKTENENLKNMKQKAKDEIEDLTRWSGELKNKLRNDKKLNNDVIMYKTRCSELCKALEEEKKRRIAVECKLKEFNKYKVICDKLSEKVTRFEDDCKIISEGEKNATQNVTNLSAEFVKLNRRTSEELIILKTENEDLKIAKQKAEGETKVQKKRCGEFENMLEHAKKLDEDLKVYKAKCLQLSTALEQEKKKGTTVEGELEELKGYKTICDKLQQKVTLLKDDYNVVSKREKAAIQNVINLSADLENVNRSTTEELIVLKTENKDLKNAKQKAEDGLEAHKRRCAVLENMLEDTKEMNKDLNMYKMRCLELCKALEEEKNKVVLVECKLEEFKGYKVICDELNDKITRLEEDCRTIREREKNAIQSVTSLSADYEMLSRRTSEELTILRTENEDLKSAKQKAEDETEVQKERCGEFQNMLERAKEFDEHLKVYKDKCSELSTALEEEKQKGTTMELEEFKGYKMICDKLEDKVTILEEDYNVISEREKAAIQTVINLSADLEKASRITSEELIVLKTENNDLKNAKRKVEDEIEAHKIRCAALENMLEHAKELDKDLKMCTTSCAELSTALEEEKKKRMSDEGKLEEFHGYKKICEVLVGEVIRLEEYLNKIAPLEEDCRSAGEKEKIPNQTIINLSADLEKVIRGRNEELTKLKTRNKDLEGLKQKAENELESQKKMHDDSMENSAKLERDLNMCRAKCSELSTTLEDMRKTCIVFERNLEESDAYRMTCDESKEKAIRLEEDCKNLDELRKSAVHSVMGSRNEELTELRTKDKLKCVKRKAKDDIKSRKKRFEKMKTRLSELKSRASALVCESLIPPNPTLEVGTDSYKEPMNEETESIHSETNGGVNNTCRSHLNTNMKTSIYKCTGKDRDAADKGQVKDVKQIS